MALEVGLEPTTDRLTADCSTAELSGNKMRRQPIGTLSPCELSIVYLLGEFEPFP